METAQAPPRPLRLHLPARVDWRRHGLWAAVAALAYYGSAKLGYELGFSGPIAAIVWLPAGIGIAFVTLGGAALWPGVLAGDLLANDYSALPLGTAIAQTCGNMLEVVGTALVLRALSRRGSPLGTVRGVIALVAALAAGTAASATVGVAAAWLGGVIGAASAPEVWRTWWLGDLAGAILVVPLAVAWFRRRPRRVEQTARRRVEGAAMVAAVVLGTELACRTHLPLTYLMLPPLIWAAARFGARGATLALALSVGLTLWNTEHNVGPFHFASVTRSVLSTQLYVAVAALTTLVLAAALKEREALAERLGVSSMQLVVVAAAERRRIERNLHDGAQQRLAALAVRLNLAGQAAAAHPERAAPLFGEAERELRAAIDELRALAHGIHPAVLTTLGLADALKSLASYSAVPVRIRGLPLRRYDERTESTAYYVTAELLANVQKHARASAVTLRVGETSTRLELEVTDNGVGGVDEHAGSGLRGLRERVESVDGTFEIDSPPGRGTRVRLRLPAQDERARMREY